MNYIVSASTDAGSVKTSNQDSLNVKTLALNGETMVFAIICDGMGGLEKGEVASASMVKAFCNWVLHRLPVLYVNGMNGTQLQEEWFRLIAEYNEKIKIYGKKSAINMGTTVTAMLLTGRYFYLVNVGDSRAYEIQSDIKVLTRDHTVVAREVEQGLLTPEQAEEDPRRSVLLQCIGASDVVYPDFFFGETRKDAVYMLCSDGFRHEITPEEIFGYFHPGRMLNEAVMKESETALIALNKQRQERDNISVITIRTF